MGIQFKRKDLSCNSQFSPGGLHTITEVWNARCSARSTDVAVVAAGPFQLGGPHPWDGYCSCFQIKPKELMGLDWEVAYEFSTHPTSLPKPGTFERPPLDRPPEIEWGVEEVERAVWTAKYWTWSGTAWTLSASVAPVVASNGQRSLNPVMARWPRLTLRYARNELTFRDDVALAYTGAINSDDLTSNYVTYEPGQALCKSIAGRWVFERVSDTVLGYYRVTYSFAFDLNRFADTRLDEGTFKRDGPPNTSGWDVIKNFKDGDGLPVNGPVPLDGQGQQLAVADDLSNLIFSHWESHPSLPFAALNIVLP